MAGETEDCISFQADCLPSGSISFGRFEVESLSWERRSSFSHNRYLEEVEKFSTPGSVTQKKAYFEAHFRKKALLRQASSENQNESECQATENDIDGHTSYIEEFGDHDNGGQLEFSWYDVTPAASEEHEAIECEQEEEIAPSEYLILPTPYNEERVVDHAVEHSDHNALQTESGYDIIPSDTDKSCIIIEQKSDSKDVIVDGFHEKADISPKRPAVGLSDDDVTFPTQSGCDTIPSDKDRLCTVVEQKPDNKAVIVEELLERKDIPSTSPKVEKNNTTVLKKTRKASLRVKETMEQKTAKTKLRTQSPLQQNLRKPSAEKMSVSSDKTLTKSTGKTEKEIISRTKPAKQPPLRTPRPTSSDSKSSKIEASPNLRVKDRQENRSEKDLRARSSILPHSVSGKSETDIHQSTNRSKQIADSAKTDVKHGGSVFSFKSDERAEKRKEYYMKLEEKLHAKEAEMNEIQARTQEETEAAMKQFRKSLNFKATPMPSFYHETAPRVSEGRKMAATPARSLRMQSPASRASLREKSAAFSKALNHESPADSEPNQVPESTNKSETGKKDERSKPNIQQKQQRGDGVVKKGDSVNRVSRNGMGRKVMKTGIVGGSVAVHVAS